MTETEFDALWVNLVDRSHSAGSPSLTESERLFYAVNLLRGSVPSSGFIGYFENSTGLDILQAHQSLADMGLHTVLELLQKAQEAALGDRAISPDTDCLEVIPASLSEDEYVAESDRLSDLLAPMEEEFYHHDSAIWQALCAYADRYNLKPVDQAPPD